MKRKEKALLRINNHIVNYDRVKKELHSRWNRAFVLAKADGSFSEVYSTKRKAERVVEEKSSTKHYDEYRQKMVTNSSGEEVVKIELEEMVDPNSKVLWYNTVYNDFRYGNMYFSNYKHLLEKYDVDKNIIEFVKELVEEVKDGRGLSVIEGIEEVDLREIRRD